MLYFKTLKDAEKVLLALGQPVRLKILELLYQNDAMSISELAKEIGVTNGAVSTHVAVLLEADLVRVREELAKHGTTKLVSAKHDRLSVDLEEEYITNPYYTENIKIGHYTDYEVEGACGMATNKKMIGHADDRRVFSFSERFNAGIIWLQNGSIEYEIPNHLRPLSKIRELQISLEASSFNDDVKNNVTETTFKLNDIEIGKYTCKGEEGGRKGYLTDSWWPETLNQYGEIINLSINSEGTFIDGQHKISEVKIEDINIDNTTKVKFMIETPENPLKSGGLVLYGEKFGDYPQDIKIKVYYGPKNV